MKINVFVYFVALFLLIELELKSQTFNRPTPNQFPDIEFVIHDSSFTNEYLATPLFLSQSTARYKRSMVILDSLGYVLWYNNKTTTRYTDFKYHNDHKLFTFIDGDYFKLMDSTFVIIDSIKPINGFMNDSHEFELTDSGNFLISGKSDSIVDLSAHMFGTIQGSDTTHLVGFTIQEFDRNHNLLFEWNSNEHLDPLESFDDVYGYSAAAFDYCHGNSIEKDTDGNYMVSMRHTNSIFKIDQNTGEIIWKLGGKASSFSFPNDSGFSGQHDFRRLPNGNVSLFDNANSAPSPKVSRGVEYQLDTVNWIATKVWEYKYSPPFFSRAMGNYQRLDSGYHIIGYGLVFRPNPSFVVIDNQNNVVNELFFKDTVVNYRAHSYQIPINWNRPNVNCENKNGIITLSAPSGKREYLWSTGDTTREITVNTTGEYQVWVNEGVGMMGSYPIKVDTLSTFCNFTSLPKITNNPKSWVIDKVYDLLGREVQNRTVGSIYIVRYKNGYARKILWMQEMN